MICPPLGPTTASASPFLHSRPDIAHRHLVPRQSGRLYQLEGEGREPTHKRWTSKWIPKSIPWVQTSSRGIRLITLLSSA